MEARGCKIKRKLGFLNLFHTCQVGVTQKKVGFGLNLISIMLEWILFTLSMRSHGFVLGFPKRPHPNQWG